jgi:hypothetical protein
MKNSAEAKAVVSKICLGFIFTASPSFLLFPSLLLSTVQHINWPKSAHRPDFAQLFPFSSAAEFTVTAMSKKGIATDSRGENGRILPADSIFRHAKKGRNATI